MIIVSALAASLTKFPNVSYSLALTPPKTEKQQHFNNTGIY